MAEFNCMKIKPSFRQVKEALNKFNVIPLFVEIGEDFITPIQLYSAIKDKKDSFLLESVEGQEKISRFSFVGFKPLWVFSSKADKVVIQDRLAKKKDSYKTDKGPLYELKKLNDRFKLYPNLKHRFSGGFVGYLGYDNIRFFENILDVDNRIEYAESKFVFTKYLCIFDHREKKVKVVSFLVVPSELHSRDLRVLYEKESQGLTALVRRLSNLKEIQPLLFNVKKINYRSNMRKTSFIAKVKKAKEYIRKGDIIQAVISQRLSVDYRKDPFLIYRYLRVLNPSPYMYYLDFKDKKVIGSSPEMLLRCEDRYAYTRPIAGTRRRGETLQQDKVLSEELLNDPKERAEHVMLVDLGRNDLGRVCKQGRVELSSFMEVEKFSHVMHIVSEVKGILQRKENSLSALQACFPAGTVTGAPKIRAMQIIDELEDFPRGIYAGCLGYLSFDNNLDTAIIIRTIVVDKNKAFIQAGAGIVLDSNPEKEYRETINKAKALLTALEYAV